MPAFIFIGFWLWFISLVTGSLALSTGELQSTDGQARAMATRLVAGAVLNQIMDTGTAPASLAVAAGSAGYEDLRLEAQRPWQSYAVSPVMNDGTWQFQRAVVFSQKDNAAIDRDSYLAADANACGSSAFDAPGVWCGSKDSYWWLYDSRTDYPNQIALEKSAHRRLLQKFGHVYSLVNDNRQAFPNPGAASSTLAVLAGFGGTAANCTGTYFWAGVPLDCSDLFSVWGTPRVYNYVTEDYIAILTTSTIKNAAGTLVPVASQLDARTRVFSN